LTASTAAAAPVDSQQAEQPSPESPETEAALAELVGVVRALADRFRSVSEHASHQRQTAVSSFYAETADRLTAAADRAEAL
jgi:hypothetical protein